MAGVQSKGGKKNRKYGRNKLRGQSAQYQKERRLEKNRKRRWLQVLRREKFMNRGIALSLHAEYLTKFQRMPHDNAVGPYVPEGVRVPAKVERLLGLRSRSVK